MMGKVEEVSGGKVEGPFAAAFEALRFKRLGGRDFHDYAHSSPDEIEDKRMRSTWQNIAGARSDTEREFFFDRCVREHMDVTDIFRDYTWLNYETGEIVHYDPPEADTRKAHDEAVEFVARQMLGVALAGHAHEALDYLLDKLYRLDKALPGVRVRAHALMHFGSAGLIARSIASGRLAAADVAHYRLVSADDDIVSRLLRDGRRGDPEIVGALSAIDAAAGIDWNGPLSLWPYGGYSATVTLRAKAADKDLLPAGR